MEYYSPQSSEVNIMNVRRISILAVVCSTILISGVALAWSANKIDREVVATTELFKEEIEGGEIFLDTAAGYLVFPRVIKVGLGFGGETGEGALIVGGQTADYYRTCRIVRFAGRRTG